MLRTKLTLTALTAALFTLSAMGTTCASAKMTWFVGGTKTVDTGKVIVSSHWTVGLSFLWTDPGIALHFSCGHVTSTSMALVGLDVSEAEHITFTSCSEIEPSTCKIEPAEIETTAVTTLPTLALLPGSKKEETFLTFKPKSGNTLASINFTGSCAFAGEHPINGEVKLVAPGLETEEASHTLAGLGSTEGNNSLELAGQKAFIEGGRALLTLASGATWSFHE